MQRPMTVVDVLVAEHIDSLTEMLCATFSSDDYTSLSSWMRTQLEKLYNYRDGVFDSSKVYALEMLGLLDENRQPTFQKVTDLIDAQTSQFRSIVFPNTSDTKEQYW